MSEDDQSWVVRREEVELTSEVVGTGSWGKVVVAKFRGVRVAAKCMHQMIISDYNRRQFTREMAMSAKLRHPNLVLFIAATREGTPLILSELMVTSLRTELEKGKIPTKTHIISVSHDVACALCYMHQWRPHPIIHRDISSSNVLLEFLLNNRWRAKVSDYGSANFMNFANTASPGSIAYGAPEARYSEEQSPKMDVFSLGVLMIEMCLCEHPEVRKEQREAHIKRIKVEWKDMGILIRYCISDSPDDRPSMSEILSALEKI